MKLSFTTLACPSWDLDTIVKQAVIAGFDGVDFRGLQQQMHVYELPAFTSSLERTIRTFQEAQLELSCFSSSVHLFPHEKQEQNVREIQAYAELCQRFQTKYIRVFGGDIEGTERSRAIEVTAQHLKVLADIASGYGVKLLLETHDDWTDCRDVRSILEAANHEAVAVLWDVHHPYRTIGENPEHTWDKLGRWIAYTHWKDSYLDESQKFGHRYCLMGEGDLPLQSIYNLCQEQKYDGWYTLEWEKRWHPDIEEPEIALPQYVAYMKKLAKSNLHEE